MECVDEVVLDQRLRELRAAVNDDVALELLLELRYFLDDVATEDGRVVPLGALEGGGDHVLRHRVELVCELALDPRPDGCEALVGHTAEQEGVGSLRLLPLELIALRTP